MRLRTRRWWATLATTATIAGVVGCSDAVAPRSGSRLDPDVISIKLDRGGSLALDQANRRLIDSNGNSIALNEANYHAVRRGFNAIAFGDEIFNARQQNADFQKALKESEARGRNLRLDGMFIPGERPMQNRSISSENLPGPRYDWGDWDGCQLAVDTWRSEYNSWVLLRNDYTSLLSAYYDAISRGDYSAADNFLTISINVMVQISTAEASMLTRESFRDAICGSFGIVSGSSGGGSLAPGANTSLGWASFPTVHCEGGFGTMDVWDDTGNRIFHWEGQMVGCFTVDQT